MSIFKSTLLTSLVLASAIVFGLLGWVMSMSQTPEYRTTSTLLVIYNQDDIYDPSNALRASEKISEQLSNVVRTDAFMREVLARDATLLGKYKTYADQVDFWRNNIATATKNSFITIEVTGFSRSETHRISQMITQVLVNQSKKWHGADTAVRVILVDSPTTPEEPVKPTTALNVLVGFFIGLILSFATIYYSKYIIHHKKIN